MEKNLAPARVLVVDDEPLIRWSLCEALVEDGCCVEEAVDGRSALTAVSNAVEPFEVAIVDFRLPDSNDLTLLSRLRQIAPQMQIVLMTAFGTSEMFDAARALGVYRVLNKPFEICEIAPLVSEARSARPHS